MRPPDAIRLLATASIIAVLALPGAGCTRRGLVSTRSPAPDASAPVPNLFDVQRQIEQYIDAGRYGADVARVASDAETYLEQRASAVSKPAIVLDIDETALSNWPAYRLNGWARFVNGPCDLEQGPCGLRAWQARGQSTALRPTLALAQRARALGVAVFFISGRPSALQQATERNLREQGFEP